MNHVRVTQNFLFWGALAGLLGAPLGWLTWYALWHVADWQISNTILNRVWFSTWQSLVTVALSLLIGGGLAAAEHHWRVRRASWFMLMCTLPVFLPPAIVALGFIAVWGNGGYVNELLTWSGLSKIHFLYSPLAIIASHVFFNIPLAYLAVRLRCTQMSYHLEETAQGLGASAWQRWRTITWPRLSSAVIGVGTLILLYSFMSFALPLILGGIRYQTVEVYIYTLVTQQFDFATAAALAMAQWLLLTGVVLLAFRQLKTIREPHLESIPSNSHGYGQARVRYASARRHFVSLTRLLVALYIALPLLAVLYRGLRWEYLYRVFTAEFVSAWLRTGAIAIISCGLLLGLIIGFIWSSHRQQQRYLATAIMIVAVSAITLGVAWRLWIGQSLVGLAAGYTALLLPISVYLLLSRWRSRPPGFLETVRLLGASYRQQALAALRYLAPSALQIAALATAFIFGDIALATLLAPVGQPTAMGLSYGLLGSYRFTLATAGMSVVLATIVISVIVLLRISRIYEPRR